MTRRSIREYAEALKDRYFRSSKKKKGQILDEFVKVTGLHRKAAIRLLHRRPGRWPGKRPGRPRTYGPAAVQALRAVWEASDRLCSRRLQPFIPEMIRVLRQHGEQRTGVSIEADLHRISPSTIDRLLKPYRRLDGHRRFSTTRPGSLLKSMIPIRTFTDWQENKPGFMEIDLVAHCGESTEGFYLNTLCGVDVASGWTECLPVFGKWQELVRQAVHHMRQRLSFPLLGIDSDNGSEFINNCLYKYCRDERITFTRSRSYKKNDSCHVEQKNGNVVRRIVGYDRYSTRAAFDRLDSLYRDLSLYTNFFQPNMKLLRKTRNGAKVWKEYDEAQTPYRRLLRSSVLGETRQLEMAAIYEKLNPVELLKRINATLEELWQKADRPVTFGNRNYDSTKKVSVTD